MKQNLINVIVAFPPSDQTEQTVDHRYRSSGASRHGPESWSAGPSTTTRGAIAKSETLLSFLDPTQSLDWYQFW